MRYKSFRIRNFKGIKDTAIDLHGSINPAIFAFVGLNESGKTTVLEAIHSFSPDKATSELVGGDESSGVPYQDRVPRHLISSFTGEVSVAACVLLTDEDKQAIVDGLKDKHKIQVEAASIPNEIVFERRQIFKNGDFKENIFSLVTEFNIKTGSQKKWRVCATVEEKEAVRDVTYGLTPDIAYFPTFVFDFPRTVFLTERGTKIDRFYRRVFQDVLDYDGKGHTIQDNIINRIRNDGMRLPWLDFFSKWTALHDERSKIQHVMDRAGAVVTEVVFGRWNKIFGEDASGKEVIISPDILEGEKIDANGNKIETQDHDLSIQFQIRDGSRRFYVNDRSLGFRWFFAFMLFTQFRVARSDSKPVLFLFDEPASNLHAAAQQKLIESFPEIVTGEHKLAYTTHSHYMIEPKWLEQTFIVTNRSGTPDSVLEATSLDDESLDIKAERYRAFVNEFPNKTSYFQPILDRLQVMPSRFDMQNASVIVEGKSDYYILRYAAKLFKKPDLPLLPGIGAGTFGALVALHVGWNLKFLFVLDGDKQGKADKDKYKKFGLPNERAMTISELVTGITVIEDLLDKEALAIIQAKLQLSTTPNKNQIRSYFQEQLASNNVEDLGGGFKKSSLQLLEALERRLEPSSTKKNDAVAA